MKAQINDFKKFDSKKSNCIVGDLNVYFSGYAYPSHKARNELNLTFEKLNMENLTIEIAENVDHIVISKAFLIDKNTKNDTFNLDKKWSDHIGICLSVTEK